MKPYDQLNEAIKFATKQLEDFNNTQIINNNDFSKKVLTSMYRKIVELSEGVRVCAANGLYGPALVNYRALIEASIAFQYLLLDPQPESIDKKAKAYQVSYLENQKDALQNSLTSMYRTEAEKRNFKNILQQCEQELTQPELKNTVKQFEKLIAINKKKKQLPKWYELDNGPRNFHALAKKCYEKRGQDKELVSTLYNFLSRSAHNFMVLSDGYKTSDDIIYTKPIHAHFNINKDEYNLGVSRALLTSSILKFTEVVHPEYTTLLTLFLKKITSPM